MKEINAIFTFSTERLHEPLSVLIAETEAAAQKQAQGRRIKGVKVLTEPQIQDGGGTVIYNLAAQGLFVIAYTFAEKE